jgi:hypothetical protein
MEGARKAEDSKLLVGLARKKMLPKWLTGAAWRRLPNDLALSIEGLGWETNRAKRKLGSVGARLQRGTWAT